MSILSLSGYTRRTWLLAVGLVGMSLFAPACGGGGEPEDRPPKIEQVVSSVFDDVDGTYKIGSMVQINVHEKSKATDIAGGKIVIASGSQGYDSGTKTLTPSSDGSFFSTGTLPA